MAASTGTPRRSRAAPTRPTSSPASASRARMICRSPCGAAATGLAGCDGGLVVDLSGLKSVRVDAHARVARAEPGATLADLDRATQAFGLATPAGTDSEVGIAGLTLGGGNGWLMGAYGA